MDFNQKQKVRHFTFFTLGTILVAFSFIMMFYDRFMIIKDEVFTTMNQNMENEAADNDLKRLSEDYSYIEVDTSYLEEDNIATDKNKINTSNRNYLGYLEISKISLKAGFVSENSYYNNVNRGIQTITGSKYPDVSKTNLILAAHSGNCSICYFKTLYKLELNDTASIDYKGNNYSYKLVNTYNVPKTGQVEVKRDFNKTTLTLITCTKNSKTEQTVYIFELYAKNGESVYE